MDRPRRDRSLARSLPRRAAKGWPACLAAAVLAAASIAAPGAIAQTVSLKQGGQKVRITIGNQAKLPADFPADIALPDGYALARVKRAGASTTLGFDAPGDVDVAAMDLESRMQANGWHAANVMAPGQGRAQAWEKDARVLIAWFRPATNGGVHVQLELRPRH
jgi:hypothetical protein